MSTSKSKGLGDQIEKITKATGIKAVVDKVSEVTGRPCGCDKRKEILNEWFPAKGMLKKSEHDYLRNFFKYYNGTTLRDEKQMKDLFQIYNRVFKTRQKATNCSSCLKRIIDQLKDKYKEYEKA
tara:strand:+ start:131 stop:502 length:372 start_codon:yes stop_codon:yes gene_type:complete